MRVAHVLPAGVEPYSGVATAVVHLASQLAALGHPVEVWALHPLSQTERSMYDALLEPAGVPLVAPAGERRARLSQLLLRRPVDLIHLHSVFTVPNNVLAARAGRPYVLTPHGGYSPIALTRSRMKKTVYAAFAERRTVRRADAIVALTPSEAEHVRAFGAVAGRVHVVPNGVAPPPEDVDPGAFRRELGLADHELMLLFVGRLDVFHKGLDLLLPALVEAPSWRAVILGADARGGKGLLERMVCELELESRVVFAQPRHGRALHEALAAARLLVLPSRWEGLPMSLLEALSHGVPAVVSPAVEQVVPVAAAGAGWVATPEELGGQLAALSRQSTAVWTAASRAAVTLAASYSWESVARAHADVYALVGSGGEAPV